MHEFELIKTIFDRHGANHIQADIIKGIGDDAAVISPPMGRQLVVCTDTLVQGRHFFGEWERVEALAFDIGYKAAMVNLSDIASMGAKPHSLLLALSLPQRLNNKTWLTCFADGLFSACADSGETVSLVGGDTTAGDMLVLTITALGFGEHIVYRHGAKMGDDIFVTGCIGDASKALDDIRKHGTSPIQDKLYRPMARTQLGQELASVAHAMIDISDGLAQDLGHILEQSGVGAHLYLDALPASDELAKLDLPTQLQYQLTGGDEYELIFTAPKNACLPTDCPMYRIGEITTTQGVQLSFNGRLLDQDAPYPFLTYPTLDGFSHF